VKGLMMIEKIDEMIVEYDKWCIENKLPMLSADELIEEEDEEGNSLTTAEQKQYLYNFIERWDNAI
jgi:hypothetical protein